MNTQSDAIPQDVSIDGQNTDDNANQLEQQQQQQERPKSRREEAMELIEASRRQSFEKESGLSLGEGAQDQKQDQQQSQNKDPDNQTNTDSQLDAQAGSGTGGGAAKVLEATEDVKVKVKVDGVEQEVELSKVLSQFQKNSAADKRLEEATRLLKEAQQKAAALPAQNADNPPGGNADKGGGDQSATASSDELFGKAKQAFSSLLEGDEDAAAKAIVDLIAKQGGAAAPTQNAQLDVDQLTKAVTQRLEVDSAFAKIKTDYPDLLTDPDLDNLTVMKANAKEAAGMTRAQAMLAAAEDVYKLIGKQPAGRQQSDDKRTTRDERLARKADLDNVRPANASAASSTQESQASSPSSVIAEMAAARLGQGLPRPR